MAALIRNVQTHEMFGLTEKILPPFSMKQQDPVGLDMFIIKTKRSPSDTPIVSKIPLDE